MSALVPTLGLIAWLVGPVAVAMLTVDAMDRRKADRAAVARSRAGRMAGTSEGIGR